MFTLLKNNRKERERSVRQITRKLLVEAKPSHRHGWGLSQLLAAYKTGQALNELITPWWWQLEIHEIDILFPWDESAVNMITDDMHRNGYDEDCPAIMLFEDKVLDGKLRLEAARRAEVTPRFEIFNGEVEAALEYAVRLNVRRRSFTAGERAAILVKMRLG
jgi:hypothetical protein